MAMRRRNHAGVPRREDALADTHPMSRVFHLPSLHDTAQRLVSCGCVLPLSAYRRARGEFEVPAGKSRRTVVWAILPSSGKKISRLRISLLSVAN